MHQDNVRDPGNKQRPEGLIQRFYPLTKPSGRSLFTSFPPTSVRAGLDLTGRATFLTPTVVTRNKTPEVPMTSDVDGSI
jgi:hypothetical protein